MKFELKETIRGVPDEHLLEDMRRCAKKIGRDTITIAEYQEIGKCHPCTIQRRFGSWTKALQLAGLQPSRSKIGITNEELFENMKSLWMDLGRQPKYGDVKPPNSKYSAGTYEKRFGSWSGALRDFVAWVNSEPSVDRPEHDVVLRENSSWPERQIDRAKRRTRREITERQRFRILVREDRKSVV